MQKRTTSMNNDFYEQLNGVISGAPSYDMKIVMGDFNAKIGEDNEGYEDVMGRQALGRINDNGERLRSWCSANNLKIGSSLFKHKRIHKGTW